MTAVCQSCHAPLGSDDRFCGSCGTEVKSSDAAHSAPPSRSTPAAPHSKANLNLGKVIVGRIAICIAAPVLGMIGITPIVRFAGSPMENPAPVFFILFVGFPAGSGLLGFGLSWLTAEQIKWSIFNRHYLVSVAIATSSLIWIAGAIYNDGSQYEGPLLLTSGAVTAAGAFWLLHRLDPPQAKE